MPVERLVKLQSGYQIPTVGLGTWQATSQEELETALNIALESGYRHIDTASVYGNEHLIGQVLKKWFDSGKVNRNDIFITTKLPANGIHPEKVEGFIKESLAKLQLEYVDLYLVHFSIYLDKTVDGSGNTVFIAKDTNHLAVWRKMEEQVDAGLTRSIGLSNYNEKQIDRILQLARIKPACLQIEVHASLPQHKLVKYCHDNDIVVVAYSPLGSPGSEKRLAKILNKEERSLPNLLTDRIVAKIAEKHRKTNAQVLLRYLLQRNIVPIPKSVTKYRLQENIDIYDFSLDATDIADIGKLEVGESARVCHWKFCDGIEFHPEWPFPAV